MEREAIAELLNDKHLALFNFLNNQDDDGWETGPDGKWTTPQKDGFVVKYADSSEVDIKCPICEQNLKLYRPELESDGKISGNKNSIYR